jgi:hypothetical protein
MWQVSSTLDAVAWEVLTLHKPSRISTARAAPVSVGESPALPWFGPFLQFVTVLVGVWPVGQALLSIRRPVEGALDLGRLKCRILKLATQAGPCVAPQCPHVSVDFSAAKSVTSCWCVCLLQALRTA